MIPVSYLSKHTGTLPIKYGQSANYLGYFLQQIQADGMVVSEFQ